MGCSASGVFPSAQHPTAGGEPTVLYRSHRDKQHGNQSNLNLLDGLDKEGYRVVFGGDGGYPAPDLILLGVV